MFFKSHIVVSVYECIQFILYKTDFYEVVINLDCVIFRFIPLKNKPAVLSVNYRVIIWVMFHCDTYLQRQWQLPIHTVGRSRKTIATKTEARAHAKRISNMKRIFECYEENRMHIYKRMVCDLMSVIFNAYWSGWDNILHYTLHTYGRSLITTQNKWIEESSQFDALHV